MTEFLQNIPPNNNLKSGIILEDNIYGKCVLPDTKIIVNDKESCIENFAQNFIDTLPPKVVKAEYWYTNLTKTTYNINSYSVEKNIIIPKTINRVFVQYIKEPIIELELLDGLKIKCTQKHKFLLLTKDNTLQWRNQLTIGNNIVISSNNNKPFLSRIVNLTYHQYEGYVYDLSIEDTRNYIANNILCHNTSKPVLSLLHKPKRFSLTKNKNYNINYLVVCLTWRINFWKTHFKNVEEKEIYRITNNDSLKPNSNNKPNKPNSNNKPNKKNKLYILTYQNLNDIDWKDSNYHTIVIDYFSESKTNLKLLYKIPCQNRWLVVNNYKNINDIYNLLNNNNNNNQHIIKNELYLPITCQQVEKKLKFNEEELEGYNKYLNKFREIYLKNNINFENDEYLQKYCCYPQQKFVINLFSLDNANYQSFLDNLGNYAESFRQQIQDTNQKNCNICLTKMESKNLGITECGHLFCYTCLHDSINYKKECPQCRKKLDKENIFLYDDQSYLSEKENIKSIVGELGTKISNLISLIYSLKEDCIIFSNYDENLVKIQNILTQLNIPNSYITKSKKLSSAKNKKCVYLINYSYNFYKLDKLPNIKHVIFNEPYYELDNNLKKDKYLEVLSVLHKFKLYHLVIQDTIEEKVFQKNNTILKNILNYKKDYLVL